MKRKKLRKLMRLCLILAVVSGMTMFVGIFISLRANRLSDAYDSTPVDLGNPGNAFLYDERYCKLETTRALSHLIDVTDTDSNDYRYYAVYVSSNPQRFVLVRVEKEDFPTYEKLVGANSSEPLRVRGRIHPLSDGVKDSLKILVDSLKAMDTSGQQDYDKMFMDVYLEPEEPKDYSRLMSFGLWLVLGGLVLCGAGAFGKWYFGHQEMLSRVVTAAEFEKKNRRWENR